jgi:hypothetical protein
MSCHVNSSSSVLYKLTFVSAGVACRQCPRGLVRFPRLGQKRTSSGRIVSIVSGGEIVSAKWARAAVTLDGNHVFTGHEPMRRSSVGP